MLAPAARPAADDELFVPRLSLLGHDLMIMKESDIMGIAAAKTN